MTQTLFREDAYQAETEATVLLCEPLGIALDRTVFYPQGGGQSGDQGTLVLDDGTALRIVNTIYDSDRATILHVPAEGAPLPRLATRVIARIDWDLRYKRMRAHTALHLLSVVAPYPVTGGSVGDADLPQRVAVLDRLPGQLAQVRHAPRPDLDVFSTELLKLRSAAQTVTLKNSGTKAVSISSVTISGDFTKAGN